MIARHRSFLLSQYREGPRRFFLVGIAVIAGLGAGYALATSSLVVGAAVALGAATAAILTWPGLALLALAIPYVLSDSVSLGGLQARDVTAICFGISVLAWIRTSVMSRRMLLVLALEGGFAAAVLVSAIGFLDQPGEVASLAEIGASLLLLAAGVALGAMTGLGPTLRAIRLIVAGVAVAAAVAWVFQNGNPFAPNAFSEQSRAGTGSVVGPNGLGAFMAIGAVMEITLRRASVLTARSVLLCTLLIGVVFLSGSRGGILVLGLGLLPLTLRAKRRTVSLALAGLLVAAAGWAVVSLTSTRAVSVERLGGNAAFVETAPVLRIDAARLAIRLMIEHPITGVGYRQAAGFAASDPALGIQFDTHNEYLRIGAESGIPALILLLWLLGLCLWTGVQSMRRTDSLRAFSATAAVAAFALSLLTVQGFHIFELSAPWMLLAGAIVGAAENYPAAEGGAASRRRGLPVRSTRPHAASTYAPGDNGVM